MQESEYETKKVPGTFFLDNISASERNRFAEKGTWYLFGHCFLKNPWFAATCVLALVYTVLFTTLSYLKYYHFNSGSFDLAIYIRHLYSLRHFEVGNSILEFKSVWSSHLNPVLYPLAWLSAIIPPAALLLSVQSLASAFIGPIVFLASKDRCGNLAAFILSLAVFLHPGLQNANLFEFHTTTLAALFFALFLLAFHKNQDRLATVFIFAALMCREEAASILLLWGFRSCRQKKWAQGIIYAVISLAWVAIAVWLKKSNAAVWGGFIQTVPHHQNFTLGLLLQKLKGFAIVFGAFAFLPLIKSTPLIWSSIMLGYFAFTSHPNLTQIYFQYWCLIVPFLAFAAASTLSLERFRHWLLKALLLSSVLIHLLYSTAPWAGLGDKKTYTNNSYAEEARQALVGISGDAAVSVPNALLAHVANRKNVFLEGKIPTDFFVVEKRPAKPPGMPGDLHKQYVKARLTAVAKLIEIQTYEVQFEGKHLVALKKIKN